MRLDNLKSGQITIEVSALKPEKILNILWDNEIYTCNIIKIDLMTIRFNIHFKDYKQVETLIKKYKGKFSIRKQKYDFSKGSLVKINQNWKSSKLTVSKNDTFISGGTQNIGAYIIHPNGLVPSKICTQLANRKGIIAIK